MSASHLSDKLGVKTQAIVSAGRASLVNTSLACRRADGIRVEGIAENKRQQHVCISSQHMVKPWSNTKSNISSTHLSTSR
jgi:hypothetical protein